MQEYIFSYGTLQTEKVQLELYGRTLMGSADILRNYIISTIEVKDEEFLSKSEQQVYLIAITSKDKNDFIKGTVLEITHEELLLTDKYEPEEYKRVKVILESGKNVWIYTAVER